MKDVFISYSRRDYVDDNKRPLPGNIIDKLTRLFDDNGISYWIDREGIHSGEAFAKNISKAIADASVFLFVSSCNSNAPECWTGDEIALARNKRKHIIPLLIDDTPYNDDFALYIARLDFIDYPSEGDAAFGKLLESINKKIDELQPNRKEIRELKVLHRDLRDAIKLKELERRDVLNRLKALGVEISDEEPASNEQVNRLKAILVDKDHEVGRLKEELGKSEEKCRYFQKELDERIKLLMDVHKKELQKRETIIKEKDSEIKKLTGKLTGQPVPANTPPASSSLSFGYQFVDLGLSVKWATCNVGAAKPEESGDYFAWGETKPKSDYSEQNSITAGKTTGQLRASGIIGKDEKLASSYDAAYKNWGGAWRIPTEREINELINNCTFIFTILNRVRGYIVKSKKNGNSIFLPAAGYKNGTELKYGPSSGNPTGTYWASSPSTNQNGYAYYLNFNSDKFYLFKYNRFVGRPIRPVLG